MISAAPAATIFAPLTPAELDGLRRDTEASAVYLDALSLIDDLLCGSALARRRPQTDDVPAIDQQLQFVLSQGQMPASVLKNVLHNAGVARQLRTEAEQLRNTGDLSSLLTFAIDKFLDDAAEAYSELARSY